MTSALGDTEALEAREALVNGFAEAISRTDAIVEASFAIGGRQARLRVAGRLLARQLLRAFGHLSTRRQADDPELTIDLWDERATGVSCPRNGAHQFHVAAAPEGVVSHRIDGGLAALDRPARRIVGWRRDARALTIFEQTKPVQLLIGSWCVDRGLTIVHGGLVADHGSAALLAGRNGAGKSTTMLACAAAGLAFLADDRFVLERRPDGSFDGHSLFANVAIDPVQLERHPWLRGDAPIERGLDEKVLVALGEASGTVCARSAPIEKILLPRVSTGAAALAPAGAGQALFALAPASLLHSVGGGANGLECMAQLVARVPASTLSLGDDLAAVPALIARTLRGGTG